jgi:hypothetical protein
MHAAETVDPGIATTPDPLAQAAAIEWFANTPDGERHAFPDDRTFRRSLCEPAIRWTVAFREHGLGYCERCQIALHMRIRQASDALTVASADDQAGDHYFRPETAR